MTYLIHREVDKWMLEVSLSAFLLRLEAGCVCLKETVIPYSPNPAQALWLGTLLARLFKEEKEQRE